jgi:hypothetical protein
VSGVPGWWRRWLRLAVQRPKPSAELEAAAGPTARAEADDEAAADALAGASIELRGDELDLHAFVPRDTAEVVADYLEWAALQGLARVRIIHGKGTGTQRRIVHAVLRRHPCVVEFGTGGERGGWGSTWVSVRPPPDAAEPTPGPAGS